MLHFILVDGEENGEEDELPDNREGQDIGKESEEIMEISIHALIGSNISKTIRLPRNVKGRNAC